MLRVARVQEIDAPDTRARGRVCVDHIPSLIVKRGSQHHVSGCDVSRIRLHWWPHSAHRTSAYRMGAYQKSDQRRVYLSAGGLRKGAWAHSPLPYALSTAVINAPRPNS